MSGKLQSAEAVFAEMRNYGLPSSMFMNQFCFNQYSGVYNVHTLCTPTTCIKPRWLVNKLVHPYVLK